MKITPEFTNFLAQDRAEELDINALVDYAYDLRKKNPRGKEISNYGGWHSNNLNHSDAKLKPLFNAIQTRLDYLHDYLGFSGQKKQQLGNIWINIPPWLPHYVTASKTDEERISIAFNTDIVPK